MLGDDFATALRNRVPGLQLQVAYWQSNTFSWDHEKAIDVDGKAALVGGMNY